MRSSDWYALDWWLVRVPDAVNRVPATQSNQLAWVPLARVLTPAFMPDPAQQRAMVDYLLARGADPWKRLPHDPAQSVVGFARQVRSPLLPLLDAPARVARPTAAPPTERPATDGAPISTAVLTGPATH